MEYFCIVLIALLISPLVAAFFLSRVTKSFESRKNLAKVLLSMCLIVILAIITGVSFSVDVIDCVLICFIYLTTSYLLLWAYRFSKGFLRIITAITLVVIFTMGYLSATVGSFAIAVLVGQYMPDKTYYLDDNIIIKEHNLGFATSEYRGYKFDICKKYRWMPLLEHKVIYEKVDISPGLRKFKLSSHDYHINYDKVKHAVIISDVNNRNEFIVP
jgi:hypothetical protein